MTRLGFFFRYRYPQKRGRSRNVSRCQGLGRVCPVRLRGFHIVEMIEIARVWGQLKLAALEFSEQEESPSLARAREIARTIVLRECFDRALLDAEDYFAAALLSLIAENVQEVRAKPEGAA